MLQRLSESWITYFCPPLWTARAAMMLLYNGRRLRIGGRYSLVDKANSMSCDPLIMVSSGRAGTTLLRSMLAAGEEIAIPPETYVMYKTVLKFMSLQHLGWEDLSTLIVALFESHEEFKIWNINLGPAYRNAINLPKRERSLARIIDEIYKCYAAQQFPKAKIWGDQSPIYTLYLPWIEALYPQAKYLHLLRDGRDVVASMVEKGLSLEYATQRWIACVKRAHALRDRLPSGQFLEIRYESLVSEPSETLQRVCAFVGIEYQPQMLEYWNRPTTIEHKHMEHHRNLAKPVFTTSIGQWKERLTPDQQKYVLTKASGLLESLDYLS